jgi:predicted permease
MWTDLRFTIRSLRKAPIFVAVAVLSLALGIGATTSIFSLLYQVLLRSLPIHEPESLVLFHSDGPNPGRTRSDNNETCFSYPMFRDLRSRATAFSGVIARSSLSAGFSAGQQTERIQVELVSGNFFDTLGVQPVTGRLLHTSDEGEPGESPVVVLSYAFWQDHFAGRAVANQKILVNNHPMVIAGVAPANFHGIMSGQSPQLYLPLNMLVTLDAESGEWFKKSDFHWMSIFARLKPGLSAGQAAAAADPAYKSILREEAPEHKLRGKTRDQFLARRLELRPAAQGLNMMSQQWQKPLVVLMAMVGLLLLIGCANIANLLIARATTRQREIAIRLAIGATRGSLVRQLLTESLIVALAGGLLGLALSTILTEGLLRLLPPDEAGGWLKPTIDLQVLLFSIAVSTATGLLCGIIPAWQATRPNVAPSLKEQSTSSSGSRTHATFRKLLVVAQISLSLLLLIGAGLLARSFVNLATHNPGFRSENLLTFSLDPLLSGYTPERASSFYRQLTERSRTAPGVQTVASAMFAPFSDSDASTNVSVEGHPNREDEDTDCRLNGISPGYFHTLGLPLVAGREFTPSDNHDAPKVAVVNEAFVKYFFGNASPIGRRMAQGGGNSVKLNIEIVGVVHDSQWSNLRDKPQRFYYLPSEQVMSPGRVTYFVRTALPPEQVGSEMRTLVQQLDPAVAVFDMKTMQVRIDNSIYTDRLIATLAGAFGVLATLLAAIGLYGVIAFMVARRTTEIGIRMALGAVEGDVLRMVMREVTLLVAAGILIGVPAAFALGGLVESQLFGLKAADPLVFSGGALLLALIALAAGWIPARRAMRISPVQALKYE